MVLTLCICTGYFPWNVHFKIQFGIFHRNFLFCSLFEGRWIPDYKPMHRRPTSCWINNRVPGDLRHRWPLYCLFNSLFRLTQKKWQMLRITGPLWREFTSDQWLPLTKDPAMRKAFPYYGIIMAMMGAIDWYTLWKRNNLSELTREPSQNKRCHLTSIGIPTIKIGRSHDRSHEYEVCLPGHALDMYIDWIIVSICWRNITTALIRMPLDLTDGQHWFR